MSKKDKYQKPSSLEKFIRWGIYISAFIPLIIAADIFYIPIFKTLVSPLFTDYLSPFHFGKVIFFRTLVEILGILYLALILKDRSYLPARNTLLWAISAFTGMFLITSLTGVNVGQSFWGMLERMGGFFTFAHFWLFFIILVSVFREREHWIKLLKITVWVSVFSAMYGFLQMTNYESILGIIRIVGGGDRLRIFGTLGNAALFAGYMLVTAFISLALAAEAKRDSGRILYGAIFAFNIIAVFFTAVRGAILGVFASLVVFALLYVFANGNKILRNILVGTIIVLVIFELGLIMSSDANFVQNSGYLKRLSDVSLSTRTVQTRLWAWQAGLDGWDDSAKTMIFGWGPENFNVPFSVHFNPGFFDKPGAETLFDRAHNMFVEVLVTMGALGFIAYISIFVVLGIYLKRLWKFAEDKRDKITIAALIAGIVAYVVHNFFFFDTSANFLVFFTFMGLVYYLYEQKTKQIDRLATPLIDRQILRSVLVLGSVVLVVFSIYFTTIRPAVANNTTTEAIRFSWADEHALSVDTFEKALSYNTFISYDILNGKNRFAQYALNNVNGIGEDGRDPRQVMLSIVEHEKEFIERNPLDYLPHLYISRAYVILGSMEPESNYNDLALEHSMRALEISPKFIRAYYEVAQAYLNKGENNKAIQTFQEAVDLNPLVGISWWYLGLTKIENGDTKGGLEDLEKAFENGFSAGEAELIRAITVYSTEGNFEKVIELYKKLIGINAGEPQYFASLAVAYKTVGSVDAALEIARLGANLHPDYRAEFEAFAQSIGRAL
ncbi:MAG: O-antigen ligase family protein [Parcubacteria group bacterium]